MLKFLGHVMFATRWLLVPMYLGLFAALAVYNIKFYEQLWAMVAIFSTISETDLLLIVLGFIDTIMVANLVVLIGVSGYSIFVREYRDGDLGEKPRWFNNINSGTQKIKMGMSLIGVSVVHMLRDFMEANLVPWDQILKEGFILGLFLFSTYVLCMIDDKLHAIPHTPGEHS